MKTCPKCGSNEGFVYTLVLKTSRYGKWGEDDDEETEAERVYDPKTVSCIRCGKRINYDLAHG